MEAFFLILDMSVLFFFQHYKGKKKKKSGIVSLSSVILGTKRIWGDSFDYQDGGGGLLVYFLFILFVLPKVQLIFRTTIH